MRKTIYDRVMDNIKNWRDGLKIPGVEPCFAFSSLCFAKISKVLLLFQNNIAFLYS